MPTPVVPDLDDPRTESCYRKGNCRRYAPMVLRVGGLIESTIASCFTRQSHGANTRLLHHMASVWELCVQSDGTATSAAFILAHILRNPVRLIAPALVSRRVLRL